VPGSLETTAASPSDRLHFQILDHPLQPLAFRFSLLQLNFPAVLLSVLRRTSGTKFLIFPGTKPVRICLRLS
jgi:hypothetical protein